MKKHQPSFIYEKKLWDSGLGFVAGIDEVGRGAFAGPIVAAAVVFSPNIQNITSIIRIDNSKKLTEKQRELANKWIFDNAICWGIGEVKSSEIDRVGIVKTSQKAYRLAVNDANNKLKSRIEYLLIDAFYIPNFRGYPITPNSKKNSYQQPIIKGDGKSISIAAASIVAKVYRDNLLKKLAKKKHFRKYGWEKNKGYGTREHQYAILKYGVTNQHRSMFVNSFMTNHSLSNSSSSQARFGA